MLGESCKDTPMTDEQVIARVRAGETELFEVVMRRYNQRLYRVSRSILHDEAEAEDVMQQAYVNAYLHLDQFEERSSFATWLTKIAVYESLARARRRSRFQSIDSTSEGESGTMDALKSTEADPERQASLDEVGRVLEAAIEALPEHYRTVFVMRDVEGMSTAETAGSLDLAEETVKTRLHRARLSLRQTLYERAGLAAPGAFPFNAARCDRVVTAFFTQIALLKTEDCRRP